MDINNETSRPEELVSAPTTAHYATTDLGNKGFNPILPVNMFVAIVITFQKS